MRVNFVTVRNYRVHGDLTIRLPSPLTLIGGPNECGKSTLVEALHRALFLRSKVTGDAQRSMVSTCFAGHPEVEVGFSLGQLEYRLSKRFSCASGTTRLIQVGGETWHGDEAESRLAALLKVETLTGGRGVGDRAAQQWSHLWVWQGQSGQDPSEHATLQKDALLQRLQKTGGAAALQSDLDARIAERIAGAKAEIFTQAGKAKAGSKLERAESAFAAATANHRQATERLQKLREAVSEFENATQTIAQTTEESTKLSRQRDEVVQQLKRVTELRLLETNQVRELAAAHEKFEEQLRNDTRISEIRRAIQSTELALRPKAEELQCHEGALERARESCVRAANGDELAAKRLSACRQRRDFAAVCVSHREKQERLTELMSRESQVRSQQERLIRLREELAKLPDLTAAKVKKLEKLESESKEAEAALKAMAARIEVLAASAPVRVGGITVAPGEAQVITETTEITAGDGVCLRIIPGGGTSLLEAKSKALESRRHWREQLDALGLSGASEAGEMLARRKELAGEIDKTEATLEAHGAAALPDMLAKARETCAAAAAELERRHELLPSLEAPDTNAAAAQVLAAEESALELAEREDRTAKTVQKAASEAFADAEQTLQKHRRQVDQENSELEGLKAQLKLLLQSHGDDGPRTQALAETRSLRSAAELALGVTRQALDQLQPLLLEADHNRLQRALSVISGTREEAERRKIFAQAALCLDGSEDPEGALALTAARLRSAEEDLANVRRQAEAIRLLHQLFTEQERALADEFTRPLAQSISAYLQCFFGLNAQAVVTLSPDGFTGLQLVRPSEGPGATSFDSLSGGTREQVAAAVRLAMAEVLAADHDGCLPLVFDDAFANSDPDRVQTLQRMLDLAATRGLQLIILTCQPSDYAALGAQRITLRREQPKSTVRPSDP